MFVSAAASTTLKVGDKVDLQAVVEEVAAAGGTVANNLTITQLNSVKNLTIVSHNNTIAPTIIGVGGRAGARRSCRQRSFRRVQSRP